MKLGEIGQSFVFVKMVNATEWTYHTDPEGNEFRYDSYNEAAGNAEDIIRGYDGKELFLIEESRVVMVSVAIDNGSFRIRIKR